MNSPIRTTTAISETDEEGLAALKRIQDGSAPFAIVRKQGDAFATIFEGDARTYAELDQIPRKDGQPSPSGDIIDTISAIPYAQIKEKYSDAQEEKKIIERDDTQISCIAIRKQTRISIANLMRALPEDPIDLEETLTYTPDSEEFARRVQLVKDEEIGKGNGSSFTISRKAFGAIKEYSRQKLLSMFRSVEQNEYGSYTNFVFHDGEKSLIGASPERHLTVQGGTATMNPISGTLRKFPQVTKDRLLAFLRDPKEMMELFMVLDEELKQMAQMCEAGGHIIGPFLKEMSKVIHTEYCLVGKTILDCMELFRRTMFAPTVMASPISSAPLAIDTYEDDIRRYYSGALALLGRDEDGNAVLDSSILIRTAEIDNNGNMVLQAGSTITRESDKTEETKETEGKLAGLLSAILGLSKERPAHVLSTLFDEDVAMELVKRNRLLSCYYLDDQEGYDLTVDELHDKRITVIDNGDDFCHMLKHMMTRMGGAVRVVPFDAYEPGADDADLVLVGPGPGDPTDMSNAKMQKNAVIMKHLLEAKRPFLSICLGHQMLCQQLGIPLEKRADPLQGIQKEIDLFGVSEHVGFYNTFAGRQTEIDGVESSYDPETNDVYALRGKGFASFQFHPESILTMNGFAILAETLRDILKK